MSTREPTISRYTILTNAPFYCFFRLFCEKYEMVTGDNSIHWFGAWRVINQCEFAMALVLRQALELWGLSRYSTSHSVAGRI